MKNEQVKIPHTCGHYATINSADCRNEDDFIQKCKQASMRLCTSCYRDVEKNQSDKGKWR